MNNVKLNMIIHFFKLRPSIQKIDRDNQYYSGGMGVSPRPPASS